MLHGQFCACVVDASAYAPTRASLHCLLFDAATAVLCSCAQYPSREPHFPVLPVHALLVIAVFVVANLVVAPPVRHRHHVNNQTNIDL
jgi:hypothetical protein